MSQNLSQAFTQSKSTRQDDRKDEEDSEVISRKVMKFVTQIEFTYSLVKVLVSISDFFKTYFFFDKNKQ